VDKTGTHLEPDSTQNYVDSVDVAAFIEKTSSGFIWNELDFPYILIYLTS